MKKLYYCKKITLSLFCLFIGLFFLMPKVNAQSFTENFNDVSLLNDWLVLNNSATPGQDWFRGAPSVFIAQAGHDSSYIASNWQSTSSPTAATISNWLFTPNRIFSNGDVVSFYTRTVDVPAYADRLEVRLSTNGNSTNAGTTSTSVGDFTTLLLTVNPTLTTTGYPSTWTQYTLTISGLGAPTSGRVAFRYFVTSGGTAGLNSDYIGIDTYSYTSVSSAPANDNCIAATSLTPGSACVPVTGNTSGATQSQTGCAGTANNDVWYSFVAGSTGSTVTVDGSTSFDAVLEVFSGTCGSLTSLACVDVTFADGIETSTLTGLTIGQTYYIRVYDWYTALPATSTFTICVQSSFANDAAVSNVYTLGTIATPYINPHQVKALIVNSGTTALSNQAVTINVTGSNTFTNTQTILSLPVGDSTIVTFSGYSSSATGTNTVTVSVPSDGNNSNNSMAVTQTVNTTSYNHAYGSVVDGGAGFNGAAGDIAVKFNTSVATSINQVLVNFQTAGEAYRVKIWDATGLGGTPGAVLYTSTNLTAALGISPVAISPAVSISGGFYVGLEQVNTVNFNIAFQNEVPVRSQTFYAAVPSGGTWTDLSPGVNFRIMLEPVFGCIAPATPGTITGTAAVCQGSSVTYSITPVSGATSYTWTLPGGWSGTSTTNSITVTAGSTGGNITVTATNSCGTSAAATLAVTVSPTPATPGTITGNLAVCSGSSQTYSIAAVSGATGYTWTLPSGWPGSSSTTSITTNAGSAGGNVSVVAINACGSSSAQSITVSVITVPAQPGAISGSNSVCATISEVYSIGTVSGATSYTWTLPGGWTGSSTSSSITATPGSTGGTVSVTATNSCGTSTAQTLSVVVNSAPPAQPGTITGSATVCSFSSETYSVSPVSGATSYTWTLPGGWTGTSVTNSIITTAGTTGGTISVVANNGCGSGGSQILSVTINTSPLQPGSISGPTALCAGASGTYSIAAVSGATTYSWTLPGGWSGTSTNTSITVTAGTTGGNITVTANNTTCSSPAQTLSVTINNVPAQPGAISGSINVCSGANETYFIAPVSGATSYSWIMPSGWGGSSASDNVSSTVGTSSGFILVTATNSCGTSSSQNLAVNVTTAPAQPGTITGTTTVCSGSNQIYSVGSVTGATSYTWTLPSGWTGTSTTNSINAITGTSGGIITVTANNGNCSSAPQSLAITLDATPAQPGSITGLLAVCQGSSQIYSVTPVSGATSYTWTLPLGWSGTSTSNTITVSAGTAAGSISVSATNACGTGPSQSASVTVNPLPPVPVITASGNVLSSSSASGNQWNLNGTPISGETAQFHTMTGTGFYTVTVTDVNGCSATSLPFSKDDTGIYEDEKEQLFTLFPNPTRGIVNITLKSNRKIEAAYITDILGKTVNVILAQNFKSSNYSFDSNELDAGVYFFTLQVEGKTITKKLVIQ